MKHIYRMWRLVVAINKKAIKLNLFDNKIVDNIFGVEKVAFLLEYSSDDADELGKIQRVLSSCIEKNFLEIQTGKVEYICLKPDGIFFVQFSGFLNFLLKELNVVLKVYWTIVFGIATFIIGKWGGQIWDFIKHII